MIAGRGDRLLRFATREADIIGFNGASGSRHESGGLPTLAGFDAMAERVAFVRAELGERAEAPSLLVGTARPTSPHLLKVFVISPFGDLKVLGWGYNVIRMYAIVRHYSASEASIQEMVEQVDKEFADRVPEQVGAALYTAVETGGGTVMTITVFGDAESAAGAETAVAGVQKSLGARFGVRETAVQRGEVMVSRATRAMVEPVRFERGGIHG
ncbi:hypothetical protein [Nonomuraea sp. CA-141351]|uniref:hypothetical protein n=1 Tax=Nonomuraea sp. CA-141351 TaxID=3239996 RepID=UPI003D8C657C